MLTMTRGIIAHSGRIMTFTHNGSGLPSTRGAGLYFIVFLALLSRLAKDLVSPEELDIVWHISTTVVYLALLRWTLRPAPTAALLLTNIFGNLIFLSLQLLNPDAPLNTYLVAGVIAWELTALIAVVNKLVLRAQQAAKQANH